MSLRAAGISLLWSSARSAFTLDIMRLKVVWSGEEQLWPVVWLIVIARDMLVALGLSERRPTRRKIDRAQGQLRIDEGFHNEHWMTVGFHPVAAQPCRHTKQHGRTKGWFVVGCFIRQAEKSGGCCPAF